MAAIHEAEHNMGDYKLKSDRNYVIPEVGLGGCGLVVAMMIVSS